MNKWIINYEVKYWKAQLTQERDIKTDSVEFVETRRVREGDYVISLFSNSWSSVVEGVVGGTGAEGGGN